MDTRTRWDPFQDLRSVQDEMAQMSPMLAHALGLHAQQQGSSQATAWAPALDISERKDAYLVTVELPGGRARGPGGHPGGWPADHPGGADLRP
jgi:HSP20 family molecular chaperone IbpA